MAQTVKNLPAMQETMQVQSLGRRDPLGKEMAIHSRTLAWTIPGSGEPDGLWSLGHKQSDTTEATEDARNMKMLLLLLLSHFSRVRLCATP